MSYHFAPQLLLRMPVRTPADYINDIQLFLEDQLFLGALRVATISFYTVLERQQFQASKLTGKELNSLQKYINRYCFRPTPFGLFASVSLAHWIEKNDAKTTSANFSAHIEAAMPIQDIIGTSLLANQPKDLAIFESNPSIYRVLNEYRFFRTSLDETGKQREYQLQSIAFSRLLKDLIRRCTLGCSWREIVSQVLLYAQCTINDAEDYAEFLIDAQLLVHNNRLSITGTDHLSRLAIKVDDSQMRSKLLAMRSRQTSTNGIDSRFIAQLEHDFQSLLPDVKLPQDKLNVILLRENSAKLEMDFQHKLRDGLKALELLSISGPSANLSQFIQSFQQNFEGQTLPVLQALDPEAGIGYQLPDIERNNPLLETLNIPYRNLVKADGIWSSVHRMLIESWLRKKSDEVVIRLQDADLEHLKNANLPEPILGMSVLFRVSENKVFIENAGGINAPALMGRFTIADEKIASAARMMARELEAQNPDLIFAELLHLGDPHTDNVNRREHIYHYELPITAASTLPAEQQLQLSDLYIRIIHNKVMLFSGRHQKFVIPRLTSAYNHSLNKLPLFRFLADLPYQYGRSNLGLNLRHLFPGLRYYPRVEYKDTILSLATWIITEQEIENLFEETNAAGDAFIRLSTAIGLARYFSIVESDQELVFDGTSKRDIESVCNFIRQKKEVVFKEFLNQTTIKQYNAYLLPDEPFVLPKPASLKKSPIKLQRKYIPGSSWLYLKVYAPKISVNRLLLRLAPMLHKRYGGHNIRQWFFIRYDDHAPHIRLRLQVDPGSINEILLAFKTKLEDRIQQHVIREFQIDVYSRELERYAAGGMENTERFFWTSSELVLQFLKHTTTKSVASTHAFALYSISIMISTFISDIDEQHDFTLTSFQQFLPEFTEKPFKVDLDKKYRELSSGILAAFETADAGLFSGSLKAGNNFKRSLSIIKNLMVGSLDADYLRSIIHMHVNRIFTDESRKQEMICYYLLHKYLLSFKGRNKRST
ncbi:thiopeptide-type bacteriocin biosynthesis protein [Mucilaginibacter sp.]|uniref:lantibiotic dehydratase n=1 Tax=Mucilaginibacter sp. TaxID=1882438 RepID=UPI0035BBA701